MKKLNSFPRLLVVFSILAAVISSLAAAPERSLTLLSYNILNGMKLDETSGKQVFTAWLKKVDPDILALQEAQQMTQKSLEDMARTYGHPYAILLKEDGYPTALTSKYPIVAVRKVVDNMHHGFIQAEIEGHYILVVHLSPHKYRKRREEMDLLLATVRSERSKAPWLLMGDFNAESPLDADMYRDGKLAAARERMREKYPIHDNVVNGALDFEVIGRILAAGFIDVAYLKKTGPLTSQPTRRFMEPPDRAIPRRVDYIFASRELEPRIEEAKIWKDEFTDMYSDHYPVWVRLRVPSAR